METNVVRAHIEEFRETQSIVPDDATRRLTLLLLCDILDELRKNASNREKALKDYGIKP